MTMEWNTCKTSLQLMKCKTEAVTSNSESEVSDFLSSDDSSDEWLVTLHETQTEVNEAAKAQHIQELSSLHNTLHKVIFLPSINGSV